MIASFLKWVLYHYVDDFVAICKAKEATPNRLQEETKAYVWLTDLLGIPQNDFKDRERTLVIVLGIEIDTTSFTARLSSEKLEKTIDATSKILKERFVSFIDIQSLIGFLSFCSQAVRLGRVFMRRLWDFINHFPRGAQKTSLRRISTWVREDIE